MFCPSSYYGETGRGFQTRLGEHKNAVLKRDSNNAIYKHKLETSQQYGSMHQIDWEGAKLLYINENWNNRLAYESSCIKCLENFNGMSSTLGIDQFSAKMVLQSNSKTHPIQF